MIGRWRSPGFTGAHDRKVCAQRKFRYDDLVTARSQHQVLLTFLARQLGMTQLCVIFDLDGTLCDTNAVDDDCYRRAAAATLAVPPSGIDGPAST